MLKGLKSCNKKSRLLFFESLLYSQKLNTMIWYTESFSRSSKALFGYNKNEDTISEELLKPIAEFIEIIQLNIG